MAYTIPRNASSDKLYNYISNKKEWKKVWGDSIPTNEQKVLIKNCLDIIVSIDGLSIRRLANLLFYATIDELMLYWANECDIQSGKIRREKGAASLEKLIPLYGKEQAEKVFKSTYMHAKENFKKSTIINRHIMSGCTPEEAHNKFVAKQRKASKKRWDNVKASGVTPSEHLKSINPLCREYIGYTDMTEEEMELERHTHLEKCLRDKEYYIKTYGEEKGNELFEDRQQRRLNTMLDNGTGGF